MWGNDSYGGYKSRRTTDRVIREAILYDISTKYRVGNLMGVNFEKIDVMPEKSWKHTCVGVGIIEDKPKVIVVGDDGINVGYLFCNQCYKVIYFVEQVY